MNQVQDKPAEVGIKLNNLLTSILIGVCIWVGTEIRTMGNDIAEIKTANAVDRTEMKYLRERLTRHIENKIIHHTKHIYKGK